MSEGLEKWEHRAKNVEGGLEVAKRYHVIPDQ